MTRSLKESLTLFENIRDFFYDERQFTFVIETSNAPMSEWKIHLGHCEEEMVSVRIRLIRQKIDFAGFYHYEGQYHFYYADKNLYQLQDAVSKEILVFTDETRPTYNLKRLLQEIKEFQKGS